MQPRAIAVPPSPGCRRCCPLIVWSEHGRWLGLEALEGAPCAECLRHAAVLGSEQRVRVPQRPRSGRRGNGESIPPLDRCSWPEAVETVACALRPLAAAERTLLWLSAGAPGRFDLLARRVGRLVSRCIHVRRRRPADTVARLAHAAGACAAVGDADLVVAWGTAAPSAEGETIWIDPRATNGPARRHALAIRPGGDGRLALAWSAILAGDRTDALDAGGAAHDALDRVVERVAAAARPVFVLGSGLGRYPQAGATVAAIAQLARQVGARLVGPHPPREPHASGAVPLTGDYRVVGSGRLRTLLTQLTAKSTVVVIEGGDPFDIPACGESLATFLRQARSVIQFGYELDQASASADIVIPALSPWERTVGEEPSSDDDRSTLDPPRDLVGEPRFWRRVARALAWPERWFPPAAEEEPAGASLDAGASADPEDLSGALREHGEGPTLTPELWSGFKLWLVTYQDGCHAAWAERVEPVVWLSPDDARIRGVENGEPVVVHNERGQVPAIVRTDALQRPGLACLATGPGGWRRLADLAFPGPPAPGDGETWGASLVEVSKPDR